MQRNLYFPQSSFLLLSLPFLSHLRRWCAALIQMLTTPMLYMFSIIATMEIGSFLISSLFDLPSARTEFPHPNELIVRPLEQN